MQLILIAIGGALGAMCRYGVTNIIYMFIGRGFPYGTLFVNILGSFLMGICYAIITEHTNIKSEYYLGIVVGFLGAFTTFSAFSLETINLIETSQNLKAVLNILFSLTFCVFSCFLGMFLVRQV